MSLISFVMTPFQLMQYLPYTKEDEWWIFTKSKKVVPHQYVQCMGTSGFLLSSGICQAKFSLTWYYHIFIIYISTSNHIWRCPDNGSVSLRMNLGHQQTNRNSTSTRLDECEDEANCYYSILIFLFKITNLSNLPLHYFQSTPYIYC